MSITPYANADIAQKENIQQQKMETYYRFQSKIYDLTRWSFLFGRNEILALIPEIPQNANLLEIGCGTGYNLQNLILKFPEANISGVDISSNMLLKASQKIKNNSGVKLMQQAYGFEETSDNNNQYDLILFSYTLSMINPHWSTLVERAKKDLKAGGHIAVVDFEYTKHDWFGKHMSNHHVKMEDHILPYLKEAFSPVHCLSKKAYGGLWNYFLFVGRKD